jgi:Polysaccharide biosynthesis/export protein
MSNERVERVKYGAVATPNRTGGRSAWAMLAATVLLLLTALSIPGCTSTLPYGGTASLKVTVEQLDALRRFEYGYRLQPGDVLEVFVYRHQELSRKTVVRSDGLISLPLLGDVRAAGQAPQDLAKTLTGLLAQRLRTGAGAERRPGQERGRRRRVGPASQ